MEFRISVQSAFWQNLTQIKRPQTNEIETGVICLHVYVSCLPLHFFGVLPLPVYLTTVQSTVEASLFVNYSSAFYDVIAIM